MRTKSRKMAASALRADSTLSPTLNMNNELRHGTPLSRHCRNPGNNLLHISLQLLLVLQNIILQRYQILGSKNKASLNTFLENFLHITTTFGKSHLQKQDFHSQQHFVICIYPACHIQNRFPSPISADEISKQVKILFEYNVGIGKTF